MYYQQLLSSLHSLNGRGVKNACQQFILYRPLTNLIPIIEGGIAQCQRIISGFFYYAPEGSERFFNSSHPVVCCNNVSIYYGQ
jgi:hypothetical protein